MTDSGIITASKVLGTLGAVWFSSTNITLATTFIPVLRNKTTGLDPKLKTSLWNQMFSIGQVQAPIIAVSTTSLFLLSYGLQPNGYRQPYLLLCAGLMTSVLPYTFVVMKPVIQRLQIAATNTEVAITHEEDLEEWSNLAIGRAGLSILATAFAAYGLVRK